MSILLRYSPNDALQEDEYTEKEKICPREGLGVPLADGQNVFGRAIQQEVGASEAKTLWMMLLERQSLTPSLGSVCLQRAPRSSGFQVWPRAYAIGM